MRFNYLGHASWLVEASGLRLMLDPLLHERHAGGVFEVVPRRRIDPKSIRADFVFVSHAHFDHFDIDSLGALARADPDTVFVTSDDLVAEVASILGFSTVRVVAPGTQVELSGGLSFTTTPSYAPEIEWGTLYRDATGSVWNLIDTVFPSPADVAAIRAAVLGDAELDLALAPIQTLREIALSTAGDVGFSPVDHRHLLACAVATGAKTIAPSACGEALTQPYDALNRYVYPVSRARATRDLQRFSPSTNTIAPRLGQAIVVEGGHIDLEPASLPIEWLGEGDDPRFFAPIEPARMYDPNLDGRDPGEMRNAARAWCETDLAPALGRSLGGREDAGRLSLVLEIVGPDDRFALRFDGRGHCVGGTDPEYDVFVTVAESMLLDVIEGKRGWVEPLLAGLLRSSIRGAEISPGRCDPLQIAPIFPYYAIPYRRSIERAVIARARAYASRR
ncbi:MAG: MBL fold metallo-hydrolase [Polyangiaceae bacterium]|nr:MBL fold metallo-hydrolase [Polyangiaceae bacterium]